MIRKISSCGVSMVILIICHKQGPHWPVLAARSMAVLAGDWRIADNDDDSNEVYDNDDDDNGDDDNDDDDEFNDDEND